MTITHRTIETNGIRMRIAEAGAGPLVVLCHGFPESWYSWRAQLVALAEAGFHAVAPDMRGYGGTDKPAAIDQYSIFHLVGDMVGLLDALKAPQAIVAGHDWGAPVAWHAALFRPDRFKAVAGFSVPYFPRMPSRPSTLYPSSEHSVFYQTYFQEPGVADAELERDTRATIRAATWAWSGEAVDTTSAAQLMVPRAGGLLTGKEPPAVLPAWVSEADIDFYAGEFARSGFRGPLNWYRNIDRNWELTAAWAGARITVPALYMAGERDLVLKFRAMDRLLPSLATIIPGLREKHILPGCGHWIQRERAAEVNAALIRFAKGVA
jgi:pimeloyl-ACP methyl ester carboxylesterase